MLIAFAICTTLLVAVHMLALMISTCILPNIEAVCNLHSISVVHESPHERLHWYIEIAWAFSTLLGLLLFLLEIAILCWVKFYNFSKIAAWSACVVLVPVLIIFLAFAIHFYRSLVAHKYEVTMSGIRELEQLKEQIESTDVEGRNGVNLLQTGVTHIVWIPAALPAAETGDSRLERETRRISASRNAARERDGRRGGDLSHDEFWQRFSEVFLPKKGISRARAVRGTWPFSSHTPAHTRCRCYEDSVNR